ncbi:MAG: hypothetical protein D6768_06210 [Chloroflexi bacterium]|nr:MAG: hypothetical protein D6768_06210 [Chloroflexota bacterium]
MRSFFEFLTIFDSITPTLGFVEDFLNDPSFLGSNTWTFFLPFGDLIDAGWDPHMVKEMLNESGIKTWGSQITNGEFFFSVKLGQARWAEHLLSANGIPIDSKSVGAPRVKPRARHRGSQPASRKQRTADPFDSFDQFIDDLFSF